MFAKHALTWDELFHDILELILITRQLDLFWNRLNNIVIKNEIES